MLLDALSVALIVSGLFFFFGAVVGLVRFPDFYTRMHAAGKGDTLSTLLITAGMAIQVLQHIHGPVEALVAIKVLAIGLFIMLTSPTSTHALMKAGYDDGIEPVVKHGMRGVRDLGGPFLEGARPAPAEAEPAAAGGAKKKAAPRKKTPARKAASKKTAAKKATKKKATKKAARKKAAKKKSPRDEN